MLGRMHSSNNNMSAHCIPTHPHTLLPQPSRAPCMHAFRCGRATPPTHFHAVQQGGMPSSLVCKQQPRLQRLSCTLGFGQESKRVQRLRRAAGRQARPPARPAAQSMRNQCYYAHAKRQRGQEDQWGAIGSVQRPPATATSALPPPCRSSGLPSMAKRRAVWNPSGCRPARTLQLN